MLILTLLILTVFFHIHLLSFTFSLNKHLLFLVYILVILCKNILLYITIIDISYYKVLGILIITNFIKFNDIWSWNVRKCDELVRFDDMLKRYQATQHIEADNKNF